MHRSQAFLRKRKMMLVLPLLVVPFLTMAFWALGGGSNSQATLTGSPGLNLNLPDARLKEDDKLDKLSFYDRAAKDSVKQGEYKRSDPFYATGEDTTAFRRADLERMTAQTASKYGQQLNPSPYQTPGENAEEKLMQKLTALQRELNQPTATKRSEKTMPAAAQDDDELTTQVDRLQGMMQGMGASEGEDPEMKQMNSTLERILDVQHPERVRERLQEKSFKQKASAFPVSRTRSANNITLLDTPKKKAISPTGFFSAEDWQVVAEEGNAIEAFVNSNQVLIDRAVMQLRLATDVFVNGVLIPKGTMVSGSVSLQNERMEAEITSIRHGRSLFPVSLQVYDMDGLPGIYIPGSITRDVTKNSADNNLQALEMASLDPSLKAQAAAAGISTAKSLLSRKVKQVKVTVKAGYKVLLKGKNI